MDIKPISTEADYKTALKQVEQLWDAQPGTPEGNQVEILVTLIQAYESKHFPIDDPDPIEAIKFMMEQKGLNRAALEPAIGTRARVSEVLNRKRALTLPMIRALSPLLDIPLGVLVREYKVMQAA